MLDEYTQSIIKNGLRPMFEFSFFKEDVKQAAAELERINERDKLLDKASTERPLDFEEDTTTTTTANSNIDSVTYNSETTLQDYDLAQLEHDYNHEHEHQHDHHHEDQHDHHHDHPHDPEHHPEHDHEGAHDMHDHDHHDHDHSPQSVVNFPIPEEGQLGVDITRSDLTAAEREFIDINNELGLAIYRKLVKRNSLASTNLVFSPLSAVTSLEMQFLGARGDTSWEINELLKLDEIFEFNPHLVTISNFFLKFQLYTKS